MELSRSTEPLTVIGYVSAKPGREQELEDALEAIVAPTLADPGNRGYVLHVSKDHPRDFLLVEHWVSEAALAKHKEGEAFKGFFRIATSNNLIDGMPKETHWRMLTAPEVATVIK